MSPERLNRGRNENSPSARSRRSRIRRNPQPALTPNEPGLIQDLIDAENREQNILASFEKAMTEKGFEPSIGQSRTVRILAHELSVLSDHDRVSFAIRGLSGSGKTAVTEVLAKPLNDLGVEVIDERVDPQQYLKQHQELRGVVHTVLPFRDTDKNQAEEARSEREVIIDHLGFTTQEILTALAPRASNYQIAFKPVVVDPNQMVRVVQGEIEPNDQEQEVLGVLNRIASNCFGSLELASNLQYGMFRNEIVGYFLRISPEIVSMVNHYRKVDHTQSWEVGLDYSSKIRGLLAPFVQDIPEESLLHGFIQAATRELDQQNAFPDMVEEITGHEPVDGIPFEFKAANSLDLYTKLVEVILNKGGNPGINIFAPSLSEVDLEKIAKTCGIFLDPRAKIEFYVKKKGQLPQYKWGLSDLDVYFGDIPGFGHRLVDFQGGMRKAYLAVVTPTEDPNLVRVAMPFWRDELMGSKRVGRESSLFKVNKYEKEILGSGYWHYFEQVDNKPNLFFHTHEHEFHLRLAQMSIVMETLLQQLGIEYLVDYPLIGTYKYNPDEQKMVEVPNSN